MVGEQKDSEQHGELKDGEQKDGEQKHGEQEDGEQKVSEHEDGQQDGELINGVCVCVCVGGWVGVCVCEWGCVCVGGLVGGCVLASTVPCCSTYASHRPAPRCLLCVLWYLSSAPPSHLLRSHL